GQPGRDAATRLDVGRAGVGPALDVARTRVRSALDATPAGHAVTTIHAAAVAATSRTTAGTSQASRNRPFPRSTGIHAHADRQIRSIASAVVRSRIGAATSTHTLTRGLPSGAPRLRAVIATAPATR